MVDRLNAPIVIVDDARSSRVVIQRVLSNAGYRDVRVAATAPEALEMVTQRPAKVLLADWQMPEMDGLTLTRRVRELDTELNHYTSIVLLTAKEGGDHMTEAFEQGVDDYINKAATKEEVLARVYSALRISDLQNQLLETTRSLQLANRELEQHATIDLLTGIGNERYLRKRLQDSLRNCRSRGGALAFGWLTLKGVDELNGRYRDQRVGDRVLCDVATRLRQHMRPSDLAAYLGESQFAVLLEVRDIRDCDHSTLRRFIEAIRHKEFHTPVGYVSVRPSMKSYAIDADRNGTATASDLLLAARGELDDDQLGEGIVIQRFE